MGVHAIDTAEADAAISSNPTKLDTARAHAQRITAPPKWRAKR